MSPAVERSSPDTTFSSSQRTPDPCLLDDPKDKLFFLPDDDEVEDDETEETSFDDDKSILDVVSEDTIIRGPDQVENLLPKILMEIKLILLISANQQNAPPI